MTLALASLPRAICSQDLLKAPSELFTASSPEDDAKPRKAKAAAMVPMKAKEKKVPMKAKEKVATKKSHEDRDEGNESHERKKAYGCQKKAGGGGGFRR